MDTSDSRREGGFRRVFVSCKPDPCFPFSSPVTRDNLAADKRVPIETPRRGLRRPRVERSGLRGWEEREAEAQGDEAERRAGMVEQR